MMYEVVIKFKAHVEAKDSEEAQDKAYNRLPNLEPQFEIKEE